MTYDEAAAIIQQYYLGYFGRPADPAGLTAWTDLLVTGTPLSEVITFFGNPEGEEFVAIYGTDPTPEEFFTAAYGNILNRAPDAEGVTFWTGVYNAYIDDGMTPAEARGQLVADMLEGVEGGSEFDQATLANQLTLSAETTALAQDLIDEGNTDGANTLINSVRDGAFKNPDIAYPSQLTAAQADLQQEYNDLSGTDSGQIFTLTTGQDVSGVMIGSDGTTSTAGDDTFNGTVDQVATGTSANNTFSAADILNGGDGTDTLNVVMQNTSGAAGTFPVATISNMEVFNVRNVSGFNQTIDAANFVGETEINSDRSVAGSALIVTNLGTGAAAGIIGNGTGTNGALTFDYATPSDAATLNVRGGVGQTGVVPPAITISSTPNSVTINSSSGANNIGDVALGGAATALTINAASALSIGNPSATNGITGFTGTAATITVAGDATGMGAIDAVATVELGNIEAATVKTIDASGLTAGGIQAALNTRADIAVTGGAGNDVISTGAVLTSGTVAAGEGTADRLVVTANGHANTAALTAKYTGFEQIQANVGVTDIDMDYFGGANAILINDSTAGGVVTIADASATQAANVTFLNAATTAGATTPFGHTGVITLGVKGATTGGQIDTITAAANTTTALGVLNNIDLSGLTIAGVEKLNLTGNGVTTAATGAITLSTENAQALTDVTIINKGAATVNVASNHTGLNLNLDAGGVDGIATLNASLYNTTTGVTLKGGTNNDVLTGSQLSDNIAGGAGNDTLQGDAVISVATPGTAQVSTLTVGGAIETGDTFTATVNGTAYTVTAGGADTTSTIATALATAIGTSGGAIASSASATNVVTLTGLATGASFTLNGAAANRAATPETSTITVATGTYDVGDVITTTVSGNAVTYTVTGTTQTQDQVATGIAAVIQGDAGTSAIVDATAATNVVTLVSDVAGNAFTLTSTVTTQATATAATATITPTGLDATETLSVAIGGTTYSTVYNTSVTQTLTDFVTAHAAAILTQTGGAVTNSGGTALLLTGPASGAALTGGTISGSITGGNGGSVSVGSTAGITVTANPDPTVAETISAVTQGADNTQSLTHATTTDAVPQVTVGGFATDTLTGNDGQDDFVFLLGSTVAQADKITDLSLGTNVVGGQVDQLHFDSTTATPVTIALLDSTDQGNVTAAATLSDAVNIVLNSVAIVNNAVAQFTYGSNEYIVHNGTASTTGGFVVGQDTLVNVTGVTGSLDASDIVLF